MQICEFIHQSVNKPNDTLVKKDNEQTEAHKVMLDTVSTTEEEINKEIEKQLLRNNTKKKLQFLENKEFTNRVSLN